jgi:hypothetical protein
MISNARIEANRVNALKSTGPKTVEGKAASRLNAVKHGLSSQGYVLDDDFVERRTEEWGRTFHPSSPREEWVVQQMARASVRIDLCQVQEFAQRGRFRTRAAVCWEQDRQLVVEDLAARLARDPSRVVRKLLQSSQGTDWLRQRWQALARNAEANGIWDEPQRSLAFDMLGVPGTLRACYPLLPPDADGPTLAALARSEIAALDHDTADHLNDLDEFDQHVASEGLGFDTSAPAILLRRYELAAWRIFRWAEDELKYKRKRILMGIDAAFQPSSNSFVPLAPEPEPCREPEPAPSPEPAPTPTPNDPDYGITGYLARAAASRCEYQVQSCQLKPASPAPNRRARRALKAQRR